MKLDDSLRAKITDIVAYLYFLLIIPNLNVSSIPLDSVSTVYSSYLAWIISNLEED